MAEKGDKNADDSTLSRIRSHLTITRAHPLLLDEVASLADGLRSTRILGLANLGLLVERGFFSGEFFHALQAPEVQKALMGFRATSVLLDKKPSATVQAESLACPTSLKAVDDLVVSPGAAVDPPSSEGTSAVKDAGSNEFEPGRGVVVEQSRPTKTVRMQ